MPRLEPAIAKWVKTFSLPTEELRLEYFDRLDNLCEYTYPMSPELKAAIRLLFPDESLYIKYVHLIEQFSSLTIPRVRPELVNYFLKIVPSQLFLQWMRIFDRSCCSSAYRIQWTLFQDPNGGNWTSFGILNGVEIATLTLNSVQSMYANWEGTSGALIGYYDTTNGIYLQAIFPNNESGFTNFGTYESIFDPGVPITVEIDSDNVTCDLNCWTSTFTPGDTSTAELEGFGINGIQFSVATPLLEFSSPTFEADVIAELEALYAINDPELSIDVTIDGGDIIVQITSLLTFEDMTVNEHPGTSTPTFTPCE